MGRRLRLRVCTRRFFCRQPDCPRRIFTERFPEFVTARGRRTDRMTQALQQIGLALGGRGGCRLAQRLGFPTSFKGLLRLVRGVPVPERPTPQALGVDDWALRRGHRYGTLLYDLEQHQEVDLLPDRTRETLAAWLQGHPGVKVVSRDRFGPYAEGIALGAPEAVQVADRWHLLKNLATSLQRFLEGQESLLEAARSWQDMPATVLDAVEAAPAVGVEVPGLRLSHKQRLKKESRERRLARYNAVQCYWKEGLSLAEIARRTGLCYDTVTRYARAESFPEISQRPPRPTQVDPYGAYLRQRWQGGCHDKRQLFREVQQQGYPGSFSQLVVWIRSRLDSPGSGRERTAPPTGQTVGARQLAGLLLRPAEELKPTEKARLDRMAEGHPTFQGVRELVQEFRGLMRREDPDTSPEAQGRRLSDWMSRAQASGVRELGSFAVSLQGDLDAVVAGLSLTWSNGPTEGSVNRLKTIKRQMYGRAGFDLLRLRVLLPP